MYFFCIIFSLLFTVSCVASDKNELDDLQTSSLDDTLSLRKAETICLLINDISNYEFLVTSEKALNGDLKTIDSLRFLWSDFEKKLKKVIGEEGVKLGFSPDSLRSLAKIICYVEYPFGENIDSNRLYYIVDELYNKIYETEIKWALDDGEKIKDWLPEKDRLSGEYYWYLNSVKTEVSDIYEWRNDLRNEWNVWMNSTNLFIKEFTGKNYENMSNIERVIFKWRLMDYNFSMNEKNY